MHVALMLDEIRLHDEIAWFNRTVVGLVSAGLQITRILPESAPHQSAVDLTSSIPMPAAVFPWTRKAVRTQLAEQLSATGVELLHVMGRSQWDDALALADMLNIPVVFDVWNAADASAAVRIIRSQSAAALFAASDGIADLLRKSVDPSLVCTIPIGIYVDRSEESHKHANAQSAPATTSVSPENEDSSEMDVIEADNNDDDDPPTRRQTGLSIVVAGQDAKYQDMLQLLDGFHGLHLRVPEVMLFANLKPALSRRIWEAARQRNLLEQMSLIPDLESNRNLVLNADILIVPSVSGRCGSVLLEAMSNQMVIIAAADACATFPSHMAGQYEIPVQSSGLTRSKDWASAFEMLLFQPSVRTAQGEQAQQWVGEHHLNTIQVTRLNEAYDTILTGGSVRISDSGD